MQERILFEDLPYEVQQYIFNLVPHKEFFPLRTLSHQHKEIIDSIITFPQTVFNIIFQLPPSHVSAFLNFYRHSKTFQRLSQQQKNKPASMTAYQILCYALVTEDIHTIDCGKLKEAVAKIKNQIKADTNLTNEEKEKAYSWLFRLSMITNVSRNTPLFDLVYEAIKHQDSEELKTLKRLGLKLSVPIAGSP